jgi:simple sugar transport system permease protein
MAIISFLVSAIKFGMVLLFGSTGETITEKSGHLNLGLPGVMCVGTACG